MEIGILLVFVYNLMWFSIDIAGQVVRDLDLASISCL
jgi:hypothetical protein